MANASLSGPNREIFTSLGPRRRVQRPVRDLGASTGAPAALVGLLLRDVHLDVLQIDGRPRVYGSRGVRGGPALAHHRGGRFRLLVALLLPPFTLVLRLALSQGVLFSFGVILVPQTVALKECVQRQEYMCNMQMGLMMPSCPLLDIRSLITQHFPQFNTHNFFRKEKCEFFFFYGPTMKK